MDKNKRFTYSIRVFYEDTDAGGIVYYANYLKFAERARTEWLRALGINQSYFLEQKLGFVVTKVAMENKASARLDDLLTVTTTISNLKKASLQFEQEIANQENTLLCRVSVNVACVDLNKAKPCPIPAVILGALTSAR
ncbi:tol-pal system-associated acyl-CoA thioesterase [Thalassotalea ponticola]|uniref:tol-pal system-associated acyl-CoA thioesterase n=1 Tax=Thalassotalea ponticola TaxID=1523392 RepID=UPI0025B4012E|nr:tol-pal system-associated acyl-CoA thioesterase [Thalassotalea ponticola]MDN3652908.1 tol-pal system-associated acyl-CoA thioesterase [Thalassotalea ponticola]